VDYDEGSKLYTFRDKDAPQSATPVKVMDADEYKQYQFNQALRSAWLNRRNTEAGSSARSGSGDDVSRLIPKFSISNNLTSSLLGGDLLNVDISLQGAVELIFGYKWSKTDNPTIPEQYRSHGVFDFDFNYQLNASGKIGTMKPDGTIDNKITINFVSSSDFSFDYQDLLKIDYKGSEDDIIQKIEAGNVSLPLNGSLITGSQSLFGFRTDLKFGNLTIEAIASQQKGQSSTINVKGGAQATLFEITADKYDANRHFFLSHNFRNQYNNALKYLPLIQSGITITRLEVWVTNRSSRFDNARNILALDTLGTGNNPDNSNNAFYSSIKNNDHARNMSTINVAMGALQQGKDYEKVENARRLTANTEYTFHDKLGYISLNTALNSDEVLGVAYEYTSGGKAYRVGEFYDDGIAAPKVLYVKLLKGTNLSPRYNTWKLMMKNIYSLDAYQLSADDFTLNVMYRDDAVGTNVPYLSEGNVKNIPLLQVLNLDNNNAAGNHYPDGRFDFFEGVTVQSNTGRIIFPVLEPFGRDLGSKTGYPTADKYVYNELYDSTQVKAKQLADKNKFSMTGYYKSSSNSEIMLNATDIPEGSVVVTAGGIKLVENVDYNVNYTLGRVKIINPVYLQSNVPLQVSVESLNNFAMVNKTLVGANFKYKLAKNFNVGATVLHLNERPLTQKVSYGDEPISNTIWGVNASYQTGAGFITTLVDALPLISTKALSTVSVDAEFAQLLPGHSSAIGKAGATYIDDFESTKLTVDLKQYTAWMLGSTPEYMSTPRARQKYFEGSKSRNLDNGYNRAKLAWYTIDPLFLRNIAGTPLYMKDNPRTYRKNHYVREVAEKEIFPDKDVKIGVDANISVLNLAYYPKERGPYNYIGATYDADLRRPNSDGSLRNPETNFGAISRALPITDFESSNIDYIEFWLLDPFIYDKKSNGGKLFFNIGDVSEDVLKDSRKSFENGIPYPYDTALLEETAWGLVPKVQSLTTTFDNNTEARRLQDVGYDGLSSTQEKTFYNRKYQYLNRLEAWLTSAAYGVYEKDPSNDDYHYYRGDDYDRDRLDILQRYKQYNNTEGNSPVATGGMSNSATTMPNTEDLNKDNTLNELESYYEYSVDLSPAVLSGENSVGRNYITDVRTYDIKDADYGEYQKVSWYQFKIPIADGISHGDIEDFKSMRFMRMLMSGFGDSLVVLRFAKFELVRGEWRKYGYSLIETQEGLAQPEYTTATLDISAVNIEENANRTPVNYLLPPGVSRVIDNTTNQQMQRNEQAMMLTVEGLADGDARAAYKSATYDMRNFKRIQMDVHAEALPHSGNLKDGELALFVRLGTDYRYNFYEYEIPLKLTQPGYYQDNQREVVWPSENKLDVELSLFTQAKQERNNKMRQPYSAITLASMFEAADGNNTVRVVGNPNLGEVRVMMVGIKNPRQKNKMDLADDGLPKDGIVWVNELRLTNFDESGGWAANARIAANLADLGNVSLAGSMARAGFGALDTRVSERSQEDAYSYDLNTNFELGKFFPTGLGVSLPFGFAYSESFIVPKYNPFDPDILLKDALSNASSKHERDSIKKVAIEYAMRKNISFNNVRFTGGKLLSSLGPIAPGNFTVGYMYNESLARNINIERDYKNSHTLTGGYAFGTTPVTLEPWKNSKIKTEWFKIIKDFNLALYPNQYGFNTDYTDTYSEYISRSLYPGIVITPIILRERVWNRMYTLGWDITQKLKFNFNARNTSRQDISLTPGSDTLDTDQSWRNTHYGHEYNVSYTLPFNKLPILSWTNTTATYRANYDWDAPVVVGGADFPNPGNTVRNANNFQLTNTFNLLNLYNKSAYLKEVNQEFDGRATKKRDMKDVAYEAEKLNIPAGGKRVVKHNLKATGVKVQVFGENGKEVRVTMKTLDDRNVEISSREEVKNGKVVVKGKVPVPQNPAVYLTKLSLRLLMSVRNVNIVYSRGGETVLPGYTPKTAILGLDDKYNFSAPGLDFISGSQSFDFMGNFFGSSEEYILSRARRNSWLITDTSIAIDPFTMLMNNSLTMRMTIEPIRDLKIDFTANQTYSSSKSWYDINNNGSPIPTETGAFSMTVVAIGTAFENPKTENYYHSSAYQRFADARQDIAFAQARQRYGSNIPVVRDSTTGFDFPQGYSPLSQDVLIPAFAVGYLDKSVNKRTLDYADFLGKIPIPNWQITYTGLSRISALKPYIKSASLTHSYKCIYSVGSFGSNSNFSEDPTGVDAQGDYYSRYSISNVSLTESIVLGSLDVTWAIGLQTRLELRKNRRVDLSLSNNQIIENGAWDGTAGVGYTFKDVPQILNFSDKQNDKTSVTLRADFTYREDKNIIRKLAENTTQITDGRRNLAVKFTTDYLLMKDLTFRVYFDWAKNNPYVSAVNTSNLAFGFSLRYVLGL
jgi:cell surface protein SprA